VRPATFQELEAAICCPDGQCSANRNCSAWAYEDCARSVERVLGIELPGRPLEEGERA
jgi:hypothetical protein